MLPLAQPFGRVRVFHRALRRGGVLFAYRRRRLAQLRFLDNFVKLFHNSAFLLAAKNTLTFSAWAVPLAVALSMLLALMLEARIPLKSQFRTFFLSPMMVPVASVVLIWQVLFQL